MDVGDTAFPCPAPAEKTTSSRNPSSPAQMSVHSSLGQDISHDDDRSYTPSTGAAEKRKCPFVPQQANVTDLEDGEISSDSDFGPPGKIPRSNRSGLVKSKTGSVLEDDTKTPLSRNNGVLENRSNQLSGGLSAEEGVCDSEEDQEINTVYDMEDVSDNALEKLFMKGPETDGSSFNAMTESLVGQYDSSSTVNVFSDSFNSSTRTDEKSEVNPDFETSSDTLKFEMSDDSKISVASPISNNLNIQTKIENNSMTVTEDGTMEDDHRDSEEFDIIDDIEMPDTGEAFEQQYDRDAGGYDSEDLDDSEIYAWLEEGLKKGPSTLASGEKNDDAEAPIEKEKVVLKERGHNPFEVLPEGWVMVTHNSSMPVYLHRQSRVCTMSRPYFLGPGSVRRHNIPLSAIPCLHYRRELDKETGAGARPGEADTTLTEGTEPQAGEQGQEGSEAGTQVKQEAVETPTQTADSTDQPNSTESTELQKEGQVEGNGLGPTVAVTQCKDVETSVDPEAVHNYCKTLFEFQTITIKKFKSWKEKRRHLTKTKQQQIVQSLPSSTKLITCPIPIDGESVTRGVKRKEFVLNPTGKSHLCILHEYAQHVLRVQPKYIFKELENAQTPYSATVVINDIEYGTGKASSKKAAKLEAAKETLKILIPKLLKVLDEDKAPKDDLAFFDEINIEDPRVAELCNKAALQNPYQLLLECLKRNCGMGDTRCQVEKKSLPNQRCEFTITVGKHKASVVCRNKREGKQRAAQAMLQRLHPLIKSWGSILRLYGDSSLKGFKERDEKPVTELQSKANKVNNEILDRLKEAMSKLKEQKDAIKPKGTMRVNRDPGPNSMVGINL